MFWNRAFVFIPRLFLPPPSVIPSLSALLHALSVSGSRETVCSLYFAVALVFPLSRLQYETEKERDSLACHALIGPLLLWTKHPSTSSSKTPNYCNIKEQTQFIRVNITGIVQMKTNVLSLFTHPHVVPNPFHVFQWST